MELYIVTIISIGVAIASVGETFFSWTGFICQALGILAESSRLVLAAMLMKNLKLGAFLRGTAFSYALCFCALITLFSLSLSLSDPNRPPLLALPDPLSTLYYLAPLCTTLIGTACAVWELGDLPWTRMYTTEFAVTMLVNAAIAFTLNIAVVLLISNTSALVLTLAGIVKDILLVFLSVVVFESPVTPLQYAGYAVALLGLNLHKEYKKAPEKITNMISYVLTMGRSATAADRTRV